MSSRFPTTYRKKVTLYYLYNPKWKISWNNTLCFQSTFLIPSCIDFVPILLDSWMHFDIPNLIYLIYADCNILCISWSELMDDCQRARNIRVFHVFFQDKPKINQQSIVTWYLKQYLYSQYVNRNLLPYRELNLVFVRRLHIQKWSALHIFSQFFRLQNFQIFV